MDTSSRTTVATLAHRALTQRARLDVLGAVREFEGAIAEFKRCAVLPSSEPEQLVAMVRLMQGGMDDLAKLINGGTQSFHVLTSVPQKCSGCGAELTEKDYAKIVAAGSLPPPHKCEFCK